MSWDSGTERVKQSKNKREDTASELPENACKISQSEIVKLHKWTSMNMLIIPKVKRS